jgi:hypothetical protein
MEITVDIWHRADRCKVRWNGFYCTAENRTCVLKWGKGDPEWGMTATAPIDCPLRRGPITITAERTT